MNISESEVRRITQKEFLIVWGIIVGLFALIVGPGALVALVRSLFC